jgi:hypothetical protein
MHGSELHNRPYRFAGLPRQVALTTLPSGFFAWHGRGELAPVRKVVAVGRAGRLWPAAVRVLLLTLGFQSPCPNCGIAHSPIIGRCSVTQRLYRIPRGAVLLTAPSAIPTASSEQLGRPPGDSSNPPGRPTYSRVHIYSTKRWRSPATVYSVSRAATRGQAGPRFSSHDRPSYTLSVSVLVSRPPFPETLGESSRRRV